MLRAIAKLEAQRGRRGYLHYSSGFCWPIVSARCRAPPGHGDVLRLGRLDGALSPHGPEDLREVISAYQKCVANSVRRFGGFVAKYMGDRVLVYFGYPQAHEDDAERAVRAGLDLIAAVSVLKAPVSLQTRVGIATGLVVVGDLLGSGEAQERGIVGETPCYSSLELPRCGRRSAFLMRPIAAGSR